MEFCRGCDYSCCGSYSIPLSAADIFVISSEGINDFYYVCEKECGSDTCFNIRGKCYGLMMKMRIDGGCVFMRDNAEYGCGIHACKPSVCAAYPFVSNGGTVELMENRVCPKRRIPTQKDFEEAREAVQVLREEWALHKRIVDNWNKCFLSRYGWPALIPPYIMVQMLIWNVAARLGLFSKGKKQDGQ
ncbi:MAG: YkgJ family cysteine cluster protein [Candidatus Micrarchaeota archaeon]|nr:YkgJ family cysteine cluster protein [Candidatus Micrarchaeota archaeon]